MWEYYLQFILETVKKNCICKHSLQINNLNKIIKNDVTIQVKQNLHKWFNNLGIEGTIELIERNKDQSITLLYFNELKKKGLYNG